MPHSTCDMRLRALADPPRIDINGSAPFSIGYEIAVPRSSGVYVISDLRGPLYVGLSCDLRRRYEEHFFGSHNELLDRALNRPVGRPTFTWVLAPEAALVPLERELVRALCPLCNFIRFNPETNNHE